MATSSATLTTLRDRVEQLLLDTANAIFPTGVIDEGVALALEEYNLHRPLDDNTTVTPAASARETSLSSISNLLKVKRIWFPYTAGAPEFPPSWLPNTAWEIFWSAGVPTLFLSVSTAPTGSQVARIFFTKPNTLNGLNGAGSTTYPETDDGMLVLGAAGYACLSRSIDLNETAVSQSISTPNYGTLAEGFLTEFRRLIGVPE